MSLLPDRRGLIRAQPHHDQRDDEVGRFGCADAVVGGQSPVGDVSDQRRRRE